MEIKSLTFLFEAYWDISPANDIFWHLWLRTVQVPSDLSAPRHGDGTDQSEISHPMFDGSQWTLRLTPVFLRGRLRKMSFMRGLMAESNAPVVKHFGFHEVSKSDAFDWCLEPLRKRKHQFLTAWRHNILHICSLLTEFAQFSFFTSGWKFPSGR